MSTPELAIRNPLKRLYNWVIGLAYTKHGGLALFFLALAESSFFPIPPDVLLIALSVGSPKRAFRFAAICLVGSVVGGIIGYGIGLLFWQALGDLFFAYVPGFTPAVFEKVAHLYQENAAWAVFTAGFTPIPYKIFTICAGIATISFPVFVVASIVSRGLRFYLVAWLIHRYGVRVNHFIQTYFNILSVVFTALLFGGFLILKKLF